MASGAFGGTTQKCKACEKTVYFVDQLTADGRVYHKACFRCHHCKGTLKLSNYSSLDGVLYCKPHYDQLFKMTGSLDKSFEGAPRFAKADRSNGHESSANSRFSRLFVGTQDKCVVCKKTVYPIEKVALDGTPYHRSCFKCSHGGCVINPSNYVTHEGKLYCKHHHSQLFMAKGNFSQLEDRHEDIKAPTENPVPDDRHEDIKAPTENPVPDDRHEDIKAPTENPVPDDKHEDIKAPTENPVSDDHTESAS